MSTYTAGFKARMVQRMAGPESISATALATEVGVSQNTLSRWLRRASEAQPTVSPMTKKKRQSRSKGSARRTAQDKLRLVLEASALSEEELGAFLRREGVHEAELEAWRTKALATAPEYRDLSPKQIVPQLADDGVYLGSESTFYRILHEAKMQKHREPSRPPTERHKPDEHVATGPNQVWSWDITYLRGPVRGMFFYYYIVMDVWSRKIVGWTLQAEESAEHAQAMIAAACRREDVRRDQLVIHSDNGAPMKAATLLAFLQSIGVVPPFSRPSVSNDNPYSESLFRTTKYRPESPRKPFASLEQARSWAAWFVDWYDTEHRHSAIKFVTPRQRHDGDDVEILARRRELHEAAKARNPNRWTKETRDWSRPQEVALDPETGIEAASEEAA